MSHRTLLIGLAGRGRVWGDAVAAHSRFELAGLADLDREVLDEAGEAYEVPDAQRYTDYLPALSDFDAVVCAASTLAHFKIVSDILNAGAHCLVEKPITLDIDEAKQLVALADQQQRVLVVGQNYRFQPTQRFIAQAVREGELGPLSAATGQFHRHRPPRPQDAAIAYPLLFIQSIHHLDWLLSLLPSPVRSVAARNHRPPRSEWESPSICHTVMQCDDGVVASYSGSYESAGEISSYGGRWRFEFERGDLVVDDDGAVHRVTERGEASEQVFSPDADQGEQLLLDTFHAGIADGVEPPTSGRSNLATLQLIFDIIAAGETT